MDYLIVYQFKKDDFVELRLRKRYTKGARYIKAEDIISREKKRFVDVSENDFNTASKLALCV